MNGHILYTPFGANNSCTFSVRVGEAIRMRKLNQMKNYLLCCDWGTSSFRVQLVNIADQQIIGEVRSTEGVSNIFNAWKTKKKKTSPGMNFSGNN